MTVNRDVMVPKFSSMVSFGKFCSGGLPLQHNFFRLLQQFHCFRSFKFKNDLPLTLTNMLCNFVKIYYKSKAIKHLFCCQLAPCSGDVSPLLKISMEMLTTTYTPCLKKNCANLFFAVTLSNLNQL